MTGAPADRSLPSDPVRPFAARVVRPDRAAGLVTPMVDSRGLAGRWRVEPVPDEAYDDSPRAFYVYRMRDRAGDHVGVVADVRLRAFADRRARGHESVEAGRVDALVRYYADHPARSEPVALLHDHPPELSGRIADICRGRPILAFRAADGVEHTVWRAAADVEGDLADALGDGVLYIADGHHRVAARLRAWQARGEPVDDGVLCLIFPTTGLTLSAFHRRVTGPVDGTRLLDAAAGRFGVRPTEDGYAGGGIGLYVDGSWYDLAPPTDRPDGSAGLDAALLEEHVIGPVLGAAGARIEAVPDREPLEELVARCDRDAGALFVLRPPGLRALTRIADLGEHMPPKTTYFTPKPYAGIFLT